MTGEDEIRDAIVQGMDRVLAYVETLTPAEAVAIAYSISKTTVGLASDESKEANDVRATAHMNGCVVMALLQRAGSAFPQPDRMDETGHGFHEMLTLAYYEINWAKMRAQS